MSGECRCFRTTNAAELLKLLIAKVHATVAEHRQGDIAMSPGEPQNYGLRVGMKESQVLPPMSHI